VSGRFKFCLFEIRGRGSSFVPLSQKFSEKYIFLKTCGFYLAAFGKIVSVMLDIINFIDASVL
jgi:hypothetical protein